MVEFKMRKILNRNWPKETVAIWYEIKCLITSEEHQKRLLKDQMSIGFLGKVRVEQRGT